MGGQNGAIDPSPTLSVQIAVMHCISNCMVGFRLRSEGKANVAPPIQVCRQFG